MRNSKIKIKQKVSHTFQITPDMMQTQSFVAQNIFLFEMVTTAPKQVLTSKRIL